MRECLLHLAPYPPCLPHPILALLALLITVLNLIEIQTGMLSATHTAYRVHCHSESTFVYVVHCLFMTISQANETSIIIPILQMETRKVKRPVQDHTAK